MPGVQYEEKGKVVFIMALIHCPECQREISDKAEACPQCGNPMQPPSKQTEPKTQTEQQSRKNILYAAVLLIVIAGAGAYMYSVYQETKSLEQASFNAEEINKTAARDDHERLSKIFGETLITMDKYESLQTGMTYEEAAELIEVNGSEQGRSGNTVSYIWRDGKGGQITAVFKDNRLIEKKQNRLY